MVEYIIVFIVGSLRLLFSMVEISVFLEKLAWNARLHVINDAQSNDTPSNFDLLSALTDVFLPTHSCRVGC